MNTGKGKYLCKEIKHDWGRGQTLGPYLRLHIGKCTNLRCAVQCVFISEHTCVTITQNEI